MLISDWSSDVCSSDLLDAVDDRQRRRRADLEHGQQHRAAVVDVHDVGLCGVAVVDETDVAHGDVGAVDRLDRQGVEEIGRASCRERMCQSVYISVVAVSINKKITCDLK